MNGNALPPIQAWKRDTMISAVQNRYDKLFDATFGRLGIAGLWDRFDRTILSSRQMLVRTDIVIALLLGLTGMLASIWAFSQTGRVPELHTIADLWMTADAPRYAENMVTTTDTTHHRTSVHPLFSILLFPFGTLLTALGADSLTAAKVLVVAAMAANVTMFSLTIRLLGLPRPLVGIFSLLFIASSAFMHWSGIVESYPFSCLSILVALFMMFRVNKAHWGWWVLVNVLTLGILITNWIFALIAMAVRLNLKQFVAITVSSFALVVCLAVIQNAIFEKAVLFFNPHTLTRETQYFQTSLEAEGLYHEGWRPSANLRSIYVTTVVGMPAYVVPEKFQRITTSNQNSTFPEGEITPPIAAAAWVLLFLMGVWGAVRRQEIRLPMIGISLMLLFQSALHAIYGEVTSLYALNFLPLVVIVAACAWFAPLRQASVALACTVIVFGGMNNERRLQQYTDLAGCMAEIELVQRLQTWEIAKDEFLLEPEEYEALKVDLHGLCNTKTPS
jgi:hypothetical protein